MIATFQDADLPSFYGLYTNADTDCLYARGSLRTVGIHMCCAHILFDACQICCSASAMVIYG